MHGRGGPPLEGQQDHVRLDIRVCDRAVKKGSARSITNARVIGVEPIGDWSHERGANGRVTHSPGGFRRVGRDGLSGEENAGLVSLSLRHDHAGLIGVNRRPR